MLERFLFCAVLVVSLTAQQPEGSAPFQISGTVVDAVTGQPIAGARVGIGPAGSWQRAISGVSRDDGTFLFANVSAGRYNLIAQHRGYLTEFFDQHDGFTSAIVVGPGLNTTGLVVRVRPESSISGTILDEGGEPVRQAQVTLYRAGSFDGRPTTRIYLQETTDEEGFYRFRHLRAGNYFIGVSAKPWYAQRPWPKELINDRNNSARSGRFFWRDTAAGPFAEEQGTSPLDVAYPITFYPGVTEPASAAPLVLKPGEKFVADVTLQPVPALHLRITEESSGAAKGIYGLQLHKRLFSASLPVAAETRPIREGEVEIVGIAPGHYEVQFPDVNDGKTVGFSVAEIDAVNNGPLHVEQRTSSVAVSAAIRIEAGTTASVEGDLQLINTRRQDSISEHFSGAGQIEFKQHLRPGIYAVMINSKTAEFIKTLSATGAIVSGRTVEIKDSGAVKLAVTIAGGQGQVSGVALRDSKPLAGVMIVLVPADPVHNHVLFRRDQSDSDGTFTLRSVVPGRYTLLALENGWELEWSNPAVLKSYLPHGLVMQVEQNGKYDVKANVQQGQ